MKAINAHVAKVQAQAKKKKGVKTSLNVVKEYLKRFVSYLLSTFLSIFRNKPYMFGSFGISNGSYCFRNAEIYA
jgi:hypothetical protein